jgi:GNAT superfamily N-acetyltransferase
VETDEQLETGYGQSTPRGDNVCNDYLRGLADGYAALAQARGDRDMTLGDRSSPSPFVNFAVVHQPLPDEQWKAAAERMHAFFAEGSGGSFLVWSAWPTPDLTALGFGRVGHPPLMLRLPQPLTAPPVEALEIRPVADETTAGDWETALVRGFPVAGLEASPIRSLLPVEALSAPGWRHWVAYLDGAPVATSSACVGEHHVDVEFIACVPEARGRGIGAAMAAVATCAAPELPAILIASDLGRSVYHRLGYRSILRFTLWEGHRRIRD